MLWTRRALVALLLCVVGGAAACDSGCNRREEALSSPSASAAKAGAKVGTPTLLVPRSHQLIEGEEIRITPLRGVPATPAEGQAAQGSDSLWVNASGDPDSGGVPLTVNFTGEVQGGPPDLRYRWDFGDNSPPAECMKRSSPWKPRARSSRSSFAI